MVKGNLTKRQLWSRIPSSFLPLPPRPILCHGTTTQMEIMTAAGQELVPTVLNNSPPKGKQPGDVISAHEGATTSPTDISAMVTPRKGRKTPNICCKPDSFCHLVRSLADTQRGWIRDMGFGSLLQLTLTRIDRHLALWLMQKFDPESCCLRVRENCSFKLCSNDVGWVLGIPNPNLVVPRIRCASVMRILKEEYGNHKGIDERSTFRSILLSTQDEVDFKQRFLLYALGVLLCPTQSSKISPVHLRVIHNVGAAHMYHWCQYVFDWLVASAKRFKRATGSGCGFGGCSLFLMVYYIDRINIGEPVNWSLSSSRIDAWTPEKCRSVIKLDKLDNGEFGGMQIVPGVVYGHEYPVGSLQIRWEQIRSTQKIKMKETGANDKSDLANNEVTDEQLTG